MIESFSKFILNCRNRCILSCYILLFPKQAEKDAKKKARAKELKKLRKAREKKAQVLFLFFFLGRWWWFGKMSWLLNFMVFAVQAEAANPNNAPSISKEVTFFPSSSPLSAPPSFHYLVFSVSLASLHISFFLGLIDHLGILC